MKELVISVLEDKSGGGTTLSVIKNNVGRCIETYKLESSYYVIDGFQSWNCKTGGHSITYLQNDSISEFKQAILEALTDMFPSDDEIKIGDIVRLGYDGVYITEWEVMDTLDGYAWLRAVESGNMVSYHIDRLKKIKQNVTVEEYEEKLSDSLKQTVLYYRIKED